MLELAESIAAHWWQWCCLAACVGAGTTGTALSLWLSLVTGQRWAEGADRRREGRRARRVHTPPRRP